MEISKLIRIQIECLHNDKKSINYLNLNANLNLFAAACTLLLFQMKPFSEKRFLFK